VTVCGKWLILRPKRVCGQGSTPNSRGVTYSTPQTLYFNDDNEIKQACESYAKSMQQEFFF